MLEIVDPGLLATIQDGGRTEHPHLGVPRSGACDAWSLAVANLLVDAPPQAPAIEVTIGGAVVRAVTRCVVGVAGADLGARVAGQRAAIRPGTSVHLGPGDVLELPGGDAGTRAYLALPGGLDVPLTLGSASTFAPAALGGLDGRALRPGDRVRGTGDAAAAVAGRVWPRLAGDPAAASGHPIRVLPGPDLDLAGPDALDLLIGRAWTIGPHSDRMGLRLAGDPVRLPPHPELLSHGVVPGCIQLLPGGLPVVLLADAQPTGGYPVAAVVIAADLARLGQLRPGDHVRFEQVGIEAAIEARRRQREALAAGAHRIRADATWEDLAGWSGA